LGRRRKSRSQGKETRQTAHGARRVFSKCITLERVVRKKNELWQPEERREKRNLNGEEEKNKPRSISNEQ